MARAAVETARTHVAALFGAQPSQIVFTSGGTESINTVFHTLTTEPHALPVITSTAEHHATHAATHAAQARGRRVTMLGVDATGAISLRELNEALAAGPALVALLHGNNETGVLHPIGDFASACASVGARLLADTTQTLGKTDLDVSRMGCDYATASAHKLHGPKGIGALCIRTGAPIQPFMLGGSQERNRRGGTEAVPLIVGFGEAARLARQNLDATQVRWSAFKTQMIGAIRKAFPEVVVNADGAPTLQNMVSVSFPQDRYPLDGSMITVNMDLEGVAVSGGSACASGSAKPSHVMLACGHDPETAGATVRLSFGRFTSESDVVIGTETLVRVVRRMLGGS